MAPKEIRQTKKLAVLGAAAATAASLTLGMTSPPTPVAEAAAGVFTTGPVFRVLDAIGVDIVSLLPAEIQAVLTTLGVDIENVPTNSVAINDAINGVGYTGTSITPNTRAVVVVGLGLGSYAASQAYGALIDSAQGNTREGYSPLVPGGRLNPNRTNLVLVLIRNPSRPNGGLFARFAPVAALFGIDTVTPAGGRTDDTVPNVGLNTTTVDVTWAYDVMSDAPVTLNPVSWANSIAASIFLTNLLGGVELKGDAPADVLLNVSGLLAGAVSPITPDGRSFYITAVPNDLALLEPMRLPVRVINAVTGWNLGTPLADAIQPAVQILVDIGYPDVVREPDGTYHRTYDSAGVPTPLLSEFPLDSPAAYLQVPGDVVRALVKGFQDEFPILAPRAPAIQTPNLLAAELQPESPGTTVESVTSVPASVNLDAPDTTKLPTLKVVKSSVDDQVAKGRNDLRKTVAKVDADVKHAGDQLRRTVRDVGNQMKKTADDVGSAVKKAIGASGKASGKKTDTGEKASAAS